MVYAVWSKIVMDDWKKDRIGSALRGENPSVIARMKTGFAVIGDTQFLPGYCLLLSYPVVGSLNDLDAEARKDFLFDMSLIGDAITEVCKPLRINYEILGNTDPYLHAHIFPRYEWEEEEQRKRPVWLYPREQWNECQFSEERYGYLKQRLSMKLKELMDRHY